MPRSAASRPRSPRSTCSPATRSASRATTASWPASAPPVSTPRPWAWARPPTWSAWPTASDQGKGQTAMENCLQKNPDINLVYTINEPAAAGAYKALKAAGKEKGVMIVSIDGGCNGVRDVKAGVIAATSQQYPLKMAAMGVEAGVLYAKTGKKASGYVDTGVTLIK